jgi:hypothetical protein
LAFLANARAMGVAAMTPGAGVHDGLDGVVVCFLAVPPPDAAFVMSAAVIPVSSKQKWLSS